MQLSPPTFCLLLVSSPPTAPPSLCSLGALFGAPTQWAHPPREAPAALQCGRCSDLGRVNAHRKEPLHQDGGDSAHGRMGGAEGKRLRAEESGEELSRKGPVNVSLPQSHRIRQAFWGLPGSQRPLLSPVLSSKLWPGAWQYEQTQDTVHSQPQPDCLCHTHTHELQEWGAHMFDLTRS
ncbi:hypothetical protein mRhiFer1_009675 [Rhinolophus ferrumequinum]|uniref:Uncharacterized protein n=1 Tax=Rhinolophus ferrumequinum TaxID=59479 RepID=A0A7J7R358_RHIFE|nr:hypothetical protein mRhiFer1_009675 [Rhinolophus ferrumequinum]